MIDTPSTRALVVGFRILCNTPGVAAQMDREHAEDTPRRAAEAIREMISGCWEDETKILSATFDGKNYDELIYMNDISFVSVCMHHFLPFFGRVNFAYLPKSKLVGASKIPRLVDCLARRPQIQEKLAVDIVDTFQEVIDPHGCGVVIEAWHLCVSIRGAKQRPAYMKTTALRGSFKDDPTRSEFLNGIRKSTEQLWP